MWLNFAFPNNDTVQVADLPSRRIVQTLTPGKGVLHLEFSPRGEQVWLSLRDENRVEIYDPDSFARIGTLPVESPSGIFFPVRAHRTGL